MSAAIETSGPTKRYRRVTALSECAISVPEGRISALVGGSRCTGRWARCPGASVPRSHSRSRWPSGPECCCHCHLVVRLE
jgi:hypothetical protein